MDIGIKTFTAIHVILGLIGIGTGFVVMFGLLTSRRLEGWTALFLGTTVATSVTGFGFPFHELSPAHKLGIVSLIVLGAAIAGRYFFHLAGAWRWIYVAGAVLGLYLNVFVAVVQAFQKLPFLKVLAPTQSEPPFAITQLVVLLLFLALGVASVIRFRVEPARRLAHTA